jgi:hypothetical protein
MKSNAKKSKRTKLKHAYHISTYSIKSNDDNKASNQQARNMRLHKFS